MCFEISLQILCETFFILVTIPSVITKRYPHFHISYSLSSHNSVKLEFSTDFRKVFIYIYIYITFHENSPG